MLNNNERLELKAENKKIKSTENQYIKRHRKKNKKKQNKNKDR